MSLPRKVSPGTRARRAALADSIAALALAAVALGVAAGLGVVGFVALPVLAVGMLWIGVERLLRGRHARRRASLRAADHRGA